MLYVTALTVRVANIAVGGTVTVVGVVGAVGTVGTGAVGVVGLVVLKDACGICAICVSMADWLTSMVAVVDSAIEVCSPRRIIGSV
jgi:hypothetical protein